MTIAISRGRKQIRRSDEEAIVTCRLNLMYE